MTTKEKLYIAGYIDATGFNLRMTGSQGGKKKSVRFSIPCGSRPKFTSHMQNLVGGNCRKHYERSYALYLSKIDTIKLLEEIGPYIIKYRDNLKEFENFCNLNTHESSAKMKPVKFIEHKNKLEYVKGWMDKCCSLGIFRLKTEAEGSGNRRKNPRFDAIVSCKDDFKYLFSFFKNRGINLNYNTSESHGIKYKKLGASGNTAKDFLEWYKNNSNKEEVKSITDLMLKVISKKGEVKRCRKHYEDSLRYKDFVLDESILTKNLDGEGLHAEKLKRKAKEIEKRKTERKKKELQKNKAFRKRLLNKKKRELKPIYQAAKNKFLKARKIYEKEKEKWEEINSEYKLCIGTNERLHKDEFNINQTTYDGLSRYSFKHSRDLRNNKYAVAIKQAYDLRRQNPLQRISDSVSVQISVALKGNKGGRSWESVVGYTLEDLKNHLINHPSWERKMNLDNYGLWEIDHVRPKAKFDFRSEDELRQCWSLRNIQPLWARENRIKTDSYEEN